MSAEALVAKVEELGLLGYTPPEVTFLYETMETLRPGIIVEWGTNVGYSARILYEAKVLLGLRTAVHSVDIAREAPILRPEDEGKERGHHVQGLNVALHVGHGAQEAVSITAMSGRARPLFFVDDNHGYDMLSRDLEMLARDTPLAVLVVHDVTLSTLRFTEADMAVRNFFVRHVGSYVADEVAEGSGMVRLWPK